MRKRAKWETEKYDPATNFGYPKGMPRELAGPGSDDEEREREEAAEREAIVHEQEAPESTTEFPFGENVINIDDDENADWLHPKPVANKRRKGGSMKHAKKVATKKATTSTSRKGGPTVGILSLLARRKNGAKTAEVHAAFPHTVSSDILTRLRRSGFIKKDGPITDPWQITAAGRKALPRANTKGGKL
jgi:hypothetical protein